MFWLVSSWKRCLVGWFLERVCCFFLVDWIVGWLLKEWLVVVEAGGEIQWLVVKGWLVAWLLCRLFC